ncbi:MAG: proton-conducting transporter membrane subunit [Terracidiphilus sp.]|nr:proton-conducting transporter membrane subunit [Terracidiphilus sp.]MDR3799629.1 proton-conducting transporter membrane subunit [Terracidiphilus sp.]
MDAATHLSTLILIAPCSLLLGAALQILVGRLCSARAKGILAFLTCVPAIFAVIGMAPAVRGGQSIDLHLLPWDGPLALVLHVDALSVLFAFMGAVIGGLVLLYSIGYMAHDKSATRFYTLMLIFIGGFISLVFSANLFIFYLCWELVGLCSFGLVGFWYTNREAVNGARKVLLMTHIAGYGLLAGIIVLYHRAGTALWTDPRVAYNFTGGLFALMLVALVAKSVQVPLHTWIPEAMAAPTPVSALLHSACYVTSGVYLAARMHSFGAWPAAWGQSLMWIGTVTMAVGVMYAMVQTDLKRMLAFSTVSQIGYMMMGIGIGTPLAITAGLLHCLNHGFFKGGLFLTAGSVQHAAGTRDMNKLGGLAGKMPQTTLSWLIGVGSMMGIPLMSGFASKWMLYAAALQAGWAVPAMVAWAASLGTVFLGVKATSAVFLGPTTENTKDAHESPTTMIWGMGFLAAGSVVLGIAPQLAVNYFLNPILMALGMGTGVHVTWLGLSADAGSFSSTGGLVLALVSLVVGGAIYLVAYAVRPASSGAAMAGAGGGIFTGGEPLGDQGRLTAGDFSDIFQQHWHSFFRWTNVDRIYLGVWHGLQAASRALGVVVSWMERRATILLVVFAAAIFALVHWIVPGVVPAQIPAVMPLEQMPLLLICAVGLAAFALVVAALAGPASRKHIPQLLAPFLLLIGGLTVIGLLIPQTQMRLGALELAALLTVVLVWQTARSRAAKFAYLAVVLLSAGSMIASDLLADRGALYAARAFLLTGIAVKLAAVPVFFWLLALADEVSALVLGIIIAVVDMAAFGEFLLGVQTIPALLTPQPLFYYAATLTSLLAALLMLTQRSLKRLLVLSTVEDVGFLLLGAASASTLGQNGAIIAASSHALAKALLFICLAAPEADGALAVEPLALAARYPVSAFGFLFGMLAMLGIPPTLGFIGRWRLYSSAYEVGFCPLTIFIVSSILALIAYTLALTRNWWGPPPDPPPQATAHEPFLIKAVIVVLVAVLLIAGIWPRALQILMGVRP